MKAALVLLVLIGTACALQFPVEYHYIYEGRLALGIPTIRPQVAALGIKARVILQMKSKSQGLAQLTDVQVGKYNDDVKCVHLRQPIPFSFSPMPEFKSAIEKPFAVYFKEEMGEVMKVPESDVEFITNIRKSVMEMLRLEPVVANLGGIQGDRHAKLISEGRTPEAFTTEEETIFGRCETQYTLTKLPKYLEIPEKEEIKKYLKEDMQSETSSRSGSSSIPKLEEEYYRLVRSVSFDKCHDRVILQHSGAANMSHAGHGQFRSVQARSSVGTYILKGKPGSFRVERAIVEGDVITNPYGYKTHRIQAITNQTLSLEKAQDIKTAMKLPSSVRTVKTWRHEVASPFAAPEGHPKPWVNYYSKNDKYAPISPYYSLIGISPTREVIEEYKSNVMTMLDEVVSEMWSYPSSPVSSIPSIKNTKSSLATTQLYWISKMMRVLPHEIVREIFSKVFSERDITGERKQMILTDAAAASGESAPMKVLLEMMKKEQISPERIASIFLTLPNNLMAPSIIPEILEYVKSLDIERNPLMTSSALVNFASLAERVCLNHRKWNYTAPNPLFGKEICKPSEILNDFLPYLKQKALSASKSWQRAIYLQAISNLGTAHIIPVLKPYIYGKADPNSNVRRVAIYALLRKRLPDSTKEEVFDTLMKVAENLEEAPETRQAAFITLTTWHPDTAWWQRVARMTWREPSESMAAFIAFTIESLATAEEPHLLRQAQIAAFVLPLMKPFSPSTKYSFIKMFSRYCPTSKAGINVELAYLQTMRDIVPSDMWATVIQNHGDLQLHLIEVALGSEGLGSYLTTFLDALRYERSEEGSSYSSSNSRDSSSRYIQDVVQKMNKHVGAERVPEGEKEANIFLRAFDNMHQYIPINSDVIAKVAGQGGSDFLTKLLHGHKINMTKFFNPVNVEYMLPTELGLPVFGSVEMPTMNIGDIDVKLVIPEVAKPTLHELLKAKKIIVLLKSNFRHMSKLIIRTKAPIPWEKKVAEAGIENWKEINLPLYWNVTWERRPEVNNLTINLAPHTEKEFPFVHAHNVPYTQIRDIIPSVRSTDDIKVISLKRSRTPVVKVSKTADKIYTGISARWEYAGDAQYPFTSAFLSEYIMNPTRVPKLLVSPTAKQWQYSIIISPDSLCRNVSIALAYMTSEGKSGGQRTPDFSVTDSVQERLNKLKELSEGSEVHGINAQLFFNGTEFRKYEVFVALTRKIQREEKKESYKTVVAVLADRVPGYTEEPRALCAQVETISPTIKDMESLQNAVKSELEESIRGQIYFGKTCMSSKVSSFSGFLKVSSDRLIELREEMSKISNADPMNPVIEMQTPAVYDEAQLDIQFSKEELPKCLVNLTYALHDTIEGYLYPHVYFNHMQKGAQNKIKVQANRPLSSKGFTFWAQLPEKHSIFTEVKVPYEAVRIVPWLGLRQSSSVEASRIVLDVRKSNTCQIKRDLIRTYDGKRYSYRPIRCWTAAAVEATNPNEFVVHSRLTSENKFEAHILMPSKNVNVVIALGRVTINGKPLDPNLEFYFVHGNNGKIIIEIRRHGQVYEATVISKLTVRVEGGYISVQPRKTMKNKLRGICGDYDGETMYDLTGPKNCLYTNITLFQYAWTIPEGDGCDTAEVNKMKNEVEEFQNNCLKRPTRESLSESAISTYESEETFNCYQHVYPIAKSGPAVCITLESVAICREGCRTHGRRFGRRLAKCWLEKNVPKDVRENEQRGYMEVPESAPAKYRDQIKVVVFSDCTKN